MVNVTEPWSIVPAALLTVAERVTGSPVDALYDVDVLVVVVVVAAAATLSVFVSLDVLKSDGSV